MKQHQLSQNEPWLRGTLSDVPAVPRAVLHALELAQEDLNRWAGELTDDELHARPFELAPVAFHLRHIARSLDRLLTYAEGSTLAPNQIALLQTELEYRGNRQELFDELAAALERSATRIRLLATLDFNAVRHVGNKQLPSSLGGLLVHVADHTQRHVGQAITIAKILLARRSA